MPARHIPDIRLAILQEEISRKTRPRRDQQQIPVFGEVNLREYGYILNELIARRGTIKKSLRSPVTEALIKMDIGDSIVIPLLGDQALASNRRTAKKVLDNAAARWDKQVLPGGKIRLTRVPDGSPYQLSVPQNPAVEKLASMKIGQTITIKLPGRMHHDIKVNARRRRGDPTMKWRCTNLANGKIRVERTA